MNHYPHHIGDFDSETLHLTFVERALYRELRDLYFKTERALMADVQKLARRVRATTDDLRDALNGLLEEFFDLQEDGWHNDYCDSQIAAYRQKQEQQSAAGRASGVARSKKNESAEQGSSGGRTKAMPPLEESCSDGSAGVKRPLNDRSTNQNQNQNQNQINTPQPPAGGDVWFQAAQELLVHFPEHRRTRSVEAAGLIRSLVEAGTVSRDELAAAAARQSHVLGKDGGKACPGLVRWLRESRWLDVSVQAAIAAVPENWRDTRSGVIAMGMTLGLGNWDEVAEPYFARYEARVERALVQKDMVTA